ncbi:hypothetical protein IEQ34_009609 [Dendrobium chrysotoxum]|uniref:MIP18 family-like domain-containing protein n=1 Tax=Dendrobium chrysotoxum TaxID=161865 RepID=A0AAV7H2W1_DENCH|nr:hypothetical protein IEQ34_009609 [Dendrobium chrysotoxum]
MVVQQKSGSQVVVRQESGPQGVKRWSGEVQGLRWWSGEVQGLRWWSDKVQGLRWWSDKVQGLRWWPGEVQGLRWWSDEVQGLRWWSGIVQGLRWWSGEVQSLRWWSGETPAFWNLPQGVNPCKALADLTFPLFLGKPPIPCQRSPCKALASSDSPKRSSDRKSGRKLVTKKELYIKFAEENIDSTLRMPRELINANPVVHGKKERRVRNDSPNIDEYAEEPIDQQEIFDILIMQNHIIPYYALSFDQVLQYWPNYYELLFSLIFSNHVRDIKDPEHPYSLEELNVVSEDSIEVNDKLNHRDRFVCVIAIAKPSDHFLYRVTFTPTVEHCSMATIIGLCIRVKLMRSLPSRYKIDIRLAPGSHATEAAVNKQLNDKERVAAALENPNLAEVVAECLAPTFA